MESLLQSPLLLVVLGLLLLPRFLPLGKVLLGRLLTDDSLPVFAFLLIMGALVLALLNGGRPS